MKNILSFFPSLLHFFQEKELGLDKTRDKIIMLSFYSAIIICFALMIARIIEERPEMILVSSIALVASSIFLIICRKGYTQFILIFSSILYLIIAFYEGYQLNIPPQTAVYFSLVPAIIAFLIKSKIIRTILLILSIVAFIVLAYLTQSENLSNVFTFVMIVSILFVIVLAFIQLMEKQEKNLRIAMEEKNEALQMLESKHQELIFFNNMMNHDIKAPLRTIKGFSGLLKRTLKTERQFEYIDFINNSANNLEQLISDLLLYSKMNSTDLKLSNVDINETIDSICDSLQFDIKEKNVQILKSELPKTIYGNSEALRTVFQNLISNSIKYQPKDKKEHIPEINISYKSENTFDVLYIKDNGIGIDEKHIPRLFTPFMRFQSAVDYEGTGLGLSICKKIMEKHGGEISLLQEVEQGACFELKFPKAA